MKVFLSAHASYAVNTFFSFIIKSIFEMSLV